MIKRQSSTNLNVSGPQVPEEEREMEVRFQLNNIQVDEQTTPLAKVVCANTLPIAVKVTKNFATRGSPFTFKHGELLLLCFVVKVRRVHATIDGNRDYRLPIHAAQLYEKLPLDPSLDDREYNGTRSLIEATPLPNHVRVVGAQMSDDPLAIQDPDDVITIRRVEFQTHPERGRERVVIGHDVRGSEVHYSEAMNMSIYSTMIALHYLPMSEIVKYDMPQRVRLPEPKDNSNRKKLQEKVMKLHRLYTEYHVIAVRARDKSLLSIPLLMGLNFDVADATLQDLQPLLRTIFGRVNPTWGVVDVSQGILPEAFRAVPQPLEEVFNKWFGSYEGKNWLNQLNERKIDSLKHHISQQQQQINALKRFSRLTPMTNVVPPRPSRPSRVDVDGGTPRRKPTTPGTELCVHEEKPRFKKENVPPVPPKPQKAENNVPIVKSISTGRIGKGQEERGDNVVKVDKVDSGYQKVIKELKEELYKKDTVIYDLRMAERKHKDLFETLQAERDSLKASKETDRQQIIQLQSMIDRLHNQIEGNIYEDLEEPPSTYATPYSTSQKLSKEMSVEGTVDFLKQIGLPQYCDKFKLEHVDGRLLLELDEHIMIEDLKMKRLHARKLTLHLAQRS